GKAFGIDTDVPFGKLPKKHRDVILFGPSAAGLRAAKGSAKPRAPVQPDDEDDEADAEQEFKLPSRQSRSRGADEEFSAFGTGFEGIVPNLRRRYDEGSWAVQEDLEPYRTLRECPACLGQRLKPQSLAVRVKGKGIAEYVN